MHYQGYQHFDTFEEFNSFPHGWDVEFSSTVSQDYEAGLGTTIVPGIILNTARLSNATMQVGSTPPGMFTFATPLAMAKPSLWRGQPIGANTCMVFPSDRVLDAVMPDSCEIMTVALDESLVQPVLDSWDLHNEQVFALARTSDLPPQEHERFLRELSLFSEFLCRYGTDSDFPALSRGIREQMLETLLSRVIAGNLERGGASRTPAARRVKQAVDYIIAHLSGPLGITEICRHVGCSRRTLEQGFLKYVGCPPKQFIKTLRLNQCHRLLASARYDSVTDVATRCGFWHMGQFAADYRQAFGKLPSETLAAAQRGSTPTH